MFHETPAVHTYFFLIYSESRKRKAFSEPVIYDNSDEKASGVMTLTSYNELDVYRQREEEFTQLGLDRDEVQLAMNDCGFPNQVKFC